MKMDDQKSFPVRQDGVYASLWCEDDGMRTDLPRGILTPASMLPQGDERNPHFEHGFPMRGETVVVMSGDEQLRVLNLPHKRRRDSYWIVVCEDEAGFHNQMTLPVLRPLPKPKKWRVVPPEDYESITATDSSPLTFVYVSSEPPVVEEVRESGE
jgi:hypothetical protein